MVSVHGLFPAMGVKVRGEGCPVSVGSSEVCPQNQGIILVTSFCETWSQTHLLGIRHREDAHFVSHVGDYCLCAFVSGGTVGYLIY